MTIEQREAFLKKQILYAVGDRGVDPQYRLDLPMATNGGTFNMAFAGPSTVPIAWNSQAIQVRDALALLPTIGSVDYVDVTGTPAGPYIITITGMLGGQPLPADVYPFTANGAALVEPSALIVTPLREGRAPVLTTTCNQWWEEYNYVQRADLRGLFVKKKLLEILQGEARKQIDTEVGDRKEKASQQFKSIQDMLATNEQEIKDIIGVNGNSASGYAVGQMSVGKLGGRTPNGLEYGQMAIDIWGRYK
jgi:hypothetical protein